MTRAKAARDGAPAKPLMSAQYFFDSLACQSGHHCRICRDRAAGQRFRACIAARLGFADTDFPCPHGREWGITGQPAALPSAPQHSTPAVTTSPPALDPAAVAEAQRRFAICRGCEYSCDDGFACALHTGCCFGRFRSNIANTCPRVPPRW